LRIVVVAMTAATLTLMAAVGASATAGTLGGSSKAIASFANSAATTAHGDEDQRNGRCHPPKKEHKHGTPGHKHHPCEKDDD